MIPFEDEPEISVIFEFLLSLTIILLSEFESFFKPWMQDKNVYLVSGSDLEKIEEQVPENILLKCKGIFSCMGNEYWSDGELVYQKEFELEDDALKWLGSDITSNQYYGGILLSASRYDEDNKDWLYYTVPDYFKENNVKNPSKEAIQNKMMDFADDANSWAYAELHDMFAHNPTKFSPSFLKTRHVKLPEFVKIGGKEVQVYERKFGLSVKDYAIGQAKFLANIEYFPEFVKIKGFNKVGERELFAKLKIQDKNFPYQKN